METSPVTVTLRALYSFHCRLNEINHTLNRGPHILALHHQKTEQLQAKINDIEKSLKETQKIISGKQAQLDDGESRINKREKQLMESKSNDEYKSLQSEINASKMAMSVLSDEILEVIEKSETIESNLKAAQEEFTAAQNEFDAFKANMESKQPALLEKRAEITQQMQEQENDLPFEFRDLYRRAFRDSFARDGKYSVLAPLQHSFCSNCNMQQVTNKITEIAQGNFTTCSSCGCILFMPEGYIL